MFICGSDTQNYRYTYEHKGKLLSKYREGKWTTSKKNFAEGFMYV